jgi:hypothetical protein
LTDLTPDDRTVRDSSRNNFSSRPHLGSIAQRLVYIVDVDMAHVSCAYALTIRVTVGQPRVLSSIALADDDSFFDIARSDNNYTLLDHRHRG